MYCHNCGKKISDQIRFCPSCGVKVLNKQESEENLITPNGINEAAAPLSENKDKKEISLDKRIIRLYPVIVVAEVVLIYYLYENYRYTIVELGLLKGLGSTGMGIFLLLLGTTLAIEKFEDEGKLYGFKNIFFPKLDLKIRKYIYYIGYVIGGSVKALSWIYCLIGFYQFYKIEGTIMDWNVLLNPYVYVSYQYGLIGYIIVEFAKIFSFKDGQNEIEKSGEEEEEKKIIDI